MSRSACLSGRTDPAHVFGCPGCRADGRIGAAWKRLSSPETTGSPEALREGFVEGVVASVRTDRARRSVRRFWIAAAAAALFFFFAGLSQERASAPPAPTADESYAALASPDTLSGLLPN